jgi:hypothetical protein
MNDELLWNAIEGALGTDKTAYLRYSPLSEITGASDLPTAVAAHAGAHREKKAFWRTTGQTFRALDKVAAALPEDNRPYPPTTSLQTKIAVAQKARLLEGALTGEENVKVASIRREVDNDLFDMLIKQANVLGGAIKNPAARELAESVVEGGKDLGKKALQAGAVGTGLAVPLYVGGSALAEDATEEARNKALQTAAGVGGMAMLGYGANRMMDNAAYHDRHKQASADDLMTKISALTATVYIDQFLVQFDQTEKVAALREVNRDYGVSLLCDLEKTAMQIERPRQADLTGPAAFGVDPLTYFSEKRAEGPTQDQGWDAWRIANKAKAPRAAKTDPERQKSYTKLQGQSAAGPVPSAGWEVQSGVTARARNVAKDKAKTYETKSGPGGTQVRRGKGGPGGATK